MNEDRLRKLLREEPLPGAAEAEGRGRTLVERAYAERRSLDRPVLPRLAVALAAMTLLAGLTLSPAGAAVRSWIDDTFSHGVPSAEPALDELPGGGQLLVQSSAGPWVVRADGSRRLLGRYREATWSPRGLFVAATAGRSLSAIEPDGTPRWSISAGSPIADPRWSPSGFRIAYRAGRELRVVGADGRNDNAIDAGVAPVPAAWFPAGPHLLAYIDRNATLKVVDPDTGTTVTSTATTPAALQLAWAPDGSLLLERSPDAVWVRDVGTAKLGARIDVGSPRRLSLPADAQIQTAAFSPRNETIAVLLLRRAGAAPRSEVLLIHPEEGPAQRLFAVSGQLADMVWSPGGERLLLSWPDADQWLFLPAGRQGGIRAIDGIAAAFAPGKVVSASFPRISGWCCAAPQEATR